MPLVGSPAASAYLRTICLPAWVPLVGPSAVSALSSNHLSASLAAFVRSSAVPALPSSHFWVPLIGSSAVSALSSNHLSPSLGGSARFFGCLCLSSDHLSPPEPGCLWSGLRLPLLIFEPFVSQPGCLWSGLRLFLYYLRTICLPAWEPLVGSSAVSSSNLICLPARVPLVGLWLPLLYLPAVCLSAWVLLVGSSAASPLSSNHFSQLGCLWSGSGFFCFIFGPCVFQPGRLCFIVFDHLSPTLGAYGWSRVSGCVCLSSNRLSPCLGASGRASGFLCFIFEPFVSQPGCLWSVLRLPLLYLRIMSFVPQPGCLWSGLGLLSSNHLSASQGASGRGFGCLCFLFESVVSQPGCLWSGRIICFPASLGASGRPLQGARKKMAVLRS